MPCARGQMSGEKQWLRCWGPGTSVSDFEYAAQISRHSEHNGYRTVPAVAVAIGAPPHLLLPAHRSM